MPRSPRLGSMHSAASPLVISFCCGQPYYYEAADRLREDCARLDLDHDITEIEMRPGSTWIDICRHKVQFFLQMHRKHGRPILWLDVDSRLGRRPDVFDGAKCDIAGFLRGFRYLRGFDPLSVPRFFAPFALYFNVTPRVTAFLELMAGLESEFSAQATDDYFLQQAWEQHEQQLSVMVLPPDLVSHEWPLREGQLFYVGISGNASAFKAEARQHTAGILEAARRRAVLLHEANLARQSGQTAEALIFYKRALPLGSPDDALAQRIANLMRQVGRRVEAEQFLRSYRGEEEATVVRNSSLASLWRRWISPRDPR